MKTEVEIRKKLKAIENDIPNFLNDSYLSNSLWSKKRILEWVLEEEK